MTRKIENDQVHLEDFGQVSLVPAIVTLSNSRVYSNLLNCSSILPKAKWVINKGFVFRVSLGVPDVNSDH